MMRWKSPPLASGTLQVPVSSPFPQLSRRSAGPSHHRLNCFVFAHGILVKSEEFYDIVYGSILHISILLFSKVVCLSFHFGFPSVFKKFIFINFENST